MLGTSHTSALCCRIVRHARFVRLGTATLAAAGPGGPFIAAERLDLRKYAARPHLARVLCDYILYVVSTRLACTRRLYFLGRWL
jgi:hypothetical protein